MTANYWLGTPGNMQLLPSPNNPVTSDPSRGDQITISGDGSATRVALLHAKRKWTLPFLSLLPTDQDLIESFYDGLFGDGPFRLVDPTYSNVLGFDTSTMGARGSAALGWIQSGGTLTRITGAPSGVASGVLQWGGLSASKTLQPGLVANTANLSKAPVYIPGEPCTASLYVWASSAATMSLQLTGYDAAGAVNATSIATAVSATTSPQRFVISAGPNAAALASSLYVLPRLVLGGTVPTSVFIAAAQLEYAAAASAFQRGYGSPTVNFTQAPGWSTALLGYTDKTLYLAEAA